MRSPVIQQAQSLDRTLVTDRAEQQLLCMNHQPTGNAFHRTSGGLLLTLVSRGAGIYQVAYGCLALNSAFDITLIIHCSSCHAAVTTLSNGPLDEDPPGINTCFPYS